MSPILWIVIIVAVAIISVLVGYIIRKNIGEKAIGSAEQKARNMILDAQNKSETIKKEITLEAKEEAHRMRTDAEREVKERRAEIQRAERRMIQKEESLDKKLENIEKREESITKHENEILAKKKELEGFVAKQIEELEKISGLTAEEAIALATIPSKEEIYAKMLGSINSPASGLVYSVNGVMAALTRAVAAVRDQ